MMASVLMVKVFVSKGKSVQDWIRMSFAGIQHFGIMFLVLALVMILTQTIYDYQMGFGGISSIWNLVKHKYGNPTFKILNFKTRKENLIPFHGLIKCLEIVLPLYKKLIN